MDFEAIFSNISPFIRKYWLALLLGVSGLILFSYGLISLSAPSKDDVIPFSQENTASKSASLISVDVEGAVVKPGVYKLEYGSIIQDAMVASEGLAQDADRDYVSKNINLAQKLTDGAKIYIPKVGDAVQGAQTTASQTSSVSNQGLVNINTASSDLLDSLPGVGPVTAQKIINNRPYQSLEDLLSKKVVSSKVYSEIKDKITLF